MYVGFVFTISQWLLDGLRVGKRIWKQISGVVCGLKALSQMWALSMDLDGGVGEVLTTGQLWVST